MANKLNIIKFLLLLSFLYSTAVHCQTKPATDTANSNSSSSLDSLVEKYPYLSDTLSNANETGYKDTFSVGGSKFRVVMFDSANGSESGILEACANGKWHLLLTIDKSLHTDYEYSDDQNHDGYNDFIVEHRFCSIVYFYSPATHTFDTANSFVTGTSNSLIDADKNIFCDESNIKGVEENTRLYTFKGTKPVILYSVEFGHGFDTVNEVKTTTAMRLYKEGPAGSKPVLIETLNINISNDDLFGEFDYVKFWKDRYRKLLHIK